MYLYYGAKKLCHLGHSHYSYMIICQIRFTIQRNILRKYDKSIPSPTGITSTFIKSTRVNFIYFIPLATAMFSAFFFAELLQHWRKNPHSLHVFWWTIGIFFYGAGTITESINSITGYHSLNFRIWYILGALLGGAPLAQGTVYLLLKRRTAHLLSALLVIVIVVSSALVLLSPLVPVNPGEYIRLSGKLLEWRFIRFITPFINVYAFIFLVGGAIYSAVQYYKNTIDKSRCWGNVMIAIGGLLPGIGGLSSKFGHIEILYITEFIGICFIHAGYQMIKSSSAPSIYSAQAK